MTDRSFLLKTLQLDEIVSYLESYDPMDGAEDQLATVLDAVIALKLREEQLLEENAASIPDYEPLTAHDYGLKNVGGNL